MKFLIFDDRYSLAKYEYDEQVQQAFTAMQQGLDNGLASDYAVLSAPDDDKTYKQVQEVAAQFERRKPALFFLVGIGGSHLGPAAIIQALRGHYYNELNKDKMQFYAVDTLDAYQLHVHCKLLEHALKEGKEVIINIITKSGNTTETLVNGSILINILRRHRPDDYQHSIVVTTDHGSALASRAHKDGYAVLPITPKIGGRYSVLTSVGLFPLRMFGIDITSFLTGARLVRDHMLTQKTESAVARSAQAIYFHYKQGKNIHDTFLYSPTLSLLGGWYRQLVGESLGKQQNRAGQDVYTGITPTASIGTNDLHSVAQLYLGGPYDKFTTFVYDKWHDGLDIAENDLLDPIHYVVGKKVSEVRNTIIQGVALAYREGKRPYVSIEFPMIDAYFLGQFMMFKMMEIMILGTLMDVNPFDQPAVELYKTQTRKLLQ